jgi:hypothetical protein
VIILDLEDIPFFADKSYGSRWDAWIRIVMQMYALSEALLRIRSKYTNITGEIVISKDL